MIIKILKNNNLIIWEEDYHIKKLKDNNLNNYNNKENYHQFLKIIIEINIVIWKKKMIMKIDFCFY
jgi:hypothetical protein